MGLWNRILRNRRGRIHDHRCERRRSKGIYANFWDPQAPIRIARELDAFLEQKRSPPPRILRNVTILRAYENHHFDRRAPKAIGPYSQAVISNGFAFLSDNPLDRDQPAYRGRHRSADRGAC